MPPVRPLPHRPVPGSVRPQDVPRLIRLRERLAGRWQRRQRRQLSYLALAFVALAAAISMGLDIFFMPGIVSSRRTVEIIALAGVLAGVFSFAVYAIWRFDRTRRRMRGVRIRLHQVQRRLASLQHALDGGTGERPIA